MKYQVIFGYEYQMENPPIHIFNDKCEVYDFVEDALKESGYPESFVDFYHMMYELADGGSIYRPDCGVIVEIKKISD